VNTWTFFFLFPLLFLSLQVFPEGSTQLRPDTTYPGDLWVNNGGGNRRCFATTQCDPDQKLYVHIASPGEKIYMGFNAFGDPVSFRLTLNGSTVFTKTIYYGTYSQGCIMYHSQAAAGPKILNQAGYDPVTFVPMIPGDYSIEFFIPAPPQPQEIAIPIFDVTVIDTTKSPLSPIPGRLWSKNWGFNTYNNSTAGHAFLATQYILASDSIVTALNYNHMRGWNFDVTSTRNGCFPWPYRWDSSCMSRQGNHHYAEYKIFLHNPDTMEYPTGTMGVILGDSVHVDRGCDGTFLFVFSVNKPGDVNLTVESNLAPGIQPEDLILKHAVLPGSNTLNWDGLNALGEQVPCGDSVTISLNYINGLTNVALYDVETHPRGFIIELVRPPGQPIATYWNDTLLANDGGRPQLEGCYAVLPDSGCHHWTGSVGYGLGSMNTVNTWWYAMSSLLDLGKFRVECVPHTPSAIMGPPAPCSFPIPVYTVDPNPLPGCDPSAYRWVLSDLSGNIFLDSIDAGPSLELDLSPFSPGPKRLKVRGGNDLCGEGSFGPGASGEGLRIDPQASPEITNPNRFFSICSGDTTNILLEADMPETVYSYTTWASSSSISGQESGTDNPICHRLLNSGNTLDSVVYLVVPHASSCNGDTGRFIIVVSPSDTLFSTFVVSSNPVCEGSEVSLSVAPLTGGTDAHFSWFVNGIPAGPDESSFTYFPTRCDTIHCIITSPEFCTPGHQSISNILVLQLQQKVQPQLLLQPSSSPVCEGDTVEVYAIPSNGGFNPGFRWWLNGISTANTEPLFRFVPAHHDRLVCRMRSDHPCVTDSVAADTLLLEVQGPVQFIDTTLCFGIPYFSGVQWHYAAGVYCDTLPVPSGCVSVIVTNLQFLPEIPVNLGEDQAICSEYILLDAWVQGATWLWQDGSSDSLFLAENPGIYYVKVTVGDCSDSDTIILSECPVRFWIPNAFSPNGDGLNDTFHPVSNYTETFILRIYSRWGELIFESSGVEQAWDGTFNGKPCQEGVYVYQISYEYPAGEKHRLTGSLKLQR